MGEEPSGGEWCECDNDEVECVEVEGDGHPTVADTVGLKAEVDVSDADEDAIERYEQFARLVEEVFQLSVRKNVEYGDAMTRQSQARGRDPAYDSDQYAYHLLDGVLWRTGDKRSRIVSAIEAETLDPIDIKGDVRETASYWLWAALAVDDVEEQIRMRTGNESGE